MNINLQYSANLQKRDAGSQISGAQNYHPGTVVGNRGMKKMNKTPLFRHLDYNEQKPIRLPPA